MRIRLAVAAVTLIAVVVPAAWTQPGPGGGLTVREAQTSRLTGVLLVRGFVLVDRRGRLHLCERLVGTSPACGGATLFVTGVSGSQLGRLQRAAGIAWTSRPRAVFGGSAMGAWSSPRT